MRDASLLLLGLLLLPGTAVGEERRRGEANNDAVTQPADPAQQALAEQLAHIGADQKALGARQTQLARRLSDAPAELRPQLELEVKRLADESARLAKQQASLAAELRAGAHGPPR